jgi:hypothetical protein
MQNTELVLAPGESNREKSGRPSTNNMAIKRPEITGRDHISLSSIGAFAERRADGRVLGRRRRICSLLCSVDHF